MGLFNISLINVHYAEKKQRKHIILGKNVASLPFFQSYLKATLLSIKPDRFFLHSQKHS